MASFCTSRGLDKGGRRVVSASNVENEGRGATAAGGKQWQRQRAVVEMELWNIARISHELILTSPGMNETKLPRLNKPDGQWVAATTDVVMVLWDHAQARKTVPSCVCCKGGGTSGSRVYWALPGPVPVTHLAVNYSAKQNAVKAKRPNAGLPPGLVVSVVI
ncbi:hypothetical protein CPB84DRAFT_1750317 [Gymnopilus junonius]|uniref:Uncharacterized protein n=1 Tax=Gymnopilus junonius TaxID=109634 RepID=A0A9P5NFQ3_GYMJU|nr:hypothetical protein CPB84DRAFT_1750317 [Gymnopilus junonius]